jgi:hypothetical protein
LFIFTKVTIQQKTPSKRKVSESEKVSERSVTETVVNTTKHQTSTPSDKDSYQTVINPSTEAKSMSKEPCEPKNRGKTQQKTQTGQQKRRPRIAANFNFGAS